MPCAVILTALRVEYLAVCQHLTNLQEETHKGNVYERGRFTTQERDWDVGVIEIGAGNPGAALEAERAISYFNPNVILFVGVAGGIKDVNIGDVVAATKIYGYESGKAWESFHPRPEVGLSTNDLVQRARVEARKISWHKRLKNGFSRSPNVLVAPIAAGEKVIASTKSNIYEFVKSNYGDAVAVEMEGFGVLKAAHANQYISAMVIRGISDLIDGKSQADGAGSQEIASDHASAFAFEMLAELDLRNNPGDSKEPITEISQSLAQRQRRLNDIQNEIEEKEKQRLAKDCEIKSIQNKLITVVDPSHEHKLNILIDQLKDDRTKTNEQLYELEDKKYLIEQSLKNNMSR